MTTRGTTQRGRHRAESRSGRRPLLLLTGLTAGVGAAMLLGAPVLGETGTPHSRGDRPGPASASAGASAPASAPASAAASAPVAPAPPAASVQPGSVLERLPEPKPVEVPEAASGTFAVVPAGRSQGSAGAGEGLRLTTYRVEVEEGLPLDADEVAREVERTLSDPRGWRSRGHLLVRGDDSTTALRIVLASPVTADRLCAPLLTRGRLSCRNGSNVVLNAWRWQHGAETYGEDLAGYRRYLVNHETGHALGYGHLGCPEPGAPAPVMVQQTKTLLGCAPNPWPALER